MRILLVEDHDALRTMTAAYLRENGFAVDEVGAGEDALSAVRSVDYDALILDLGLPDLEGLEVLRAIRTEHRVPLPTLIVTARGRLADRLDGLNFGADDYIVKPFELAELEARLRAVLRRPGARDPAVHEFGDLSFDPQARMTRARQSVDLDLTRREACVLEELIRAKGRIVVKDKLEDRVYGFDDAIRSNALEVAVSRLRRKLAAAHSQVTIKSCRGLGYRLTVKDGAGP